MFKQEIVIYQEVVIFRLVKKDPDRQIGAHLKMLEHFCLTIDVINGDVMEAVLKLFKLIETECGKDYYNPFDFIFTDKRPCITTLSKDAIIDAYCDEDEEGEGVEEDDSEEEEIEE
jgi:hypothetical protein